MALQGPAAPAQALGHLRSISTGATFLPEPSWSRPATWDQGSSAAWQSKDAATWLGELEATQDGSQEPPGSVARGQGGCRERGTEAETGLEKLGFWQQDLKQLCRTGSPCRA